MTELLTPRERFNLLVIDEKPDRCIVLPLITSHSATVTGISLKEYYTDGVALARSQIAALEEYGHDAISIFSEVGIVAEAMGSEFEYPDDDLPILQTPALDRVDIDKLNMPEPKRDGRLHVYLDAIRYAYDALADRYPILAYVPAPFTTAMMLSNPDRFLADTLRDPLRVKSIMDISLKATVHFVREIVNAGGLPLIVDPLASSSVISPRAYRELAMPYERALIKYLHRFDLDVTLHICGNTTPILDLLPETGADLISLDKIELIDAMGKLSKKMRIIGNYDTSAILNNKPDVIGHKVKEMVKLGMTSEKGYIASTGCEVPIRTPRENIKAFIGAAKEVGWYWE
jgi:uroporphyrinogen decarboxylase